MKGWYSGSTHVHMNYGGNLHNTPENTAAMSAAEDLHIVNALASNKDNRVLDWQYFRPGAREYAINPPVPGVKILIGEEYRPAFLGHSFLIGLRDHLISPFMGSYEGTAIDSIYPSNTEIFRKAKAQGAVTGYVHPFADKDPMDAGLGAGKGLPVDAALGTVDAMEWSGAVRAEIGVWHKLLNNDIDLVPTGGEDSINDLQRFRTLGSIRTFVHLDGPFTTDAWVRNLKEGHTFFSSGPLLDFKVNGILPGGTIHLPAPGGTVRLEGSVVSAAALTKLVIYNRRGILREIPLTPSTQGRNGAQTYAEIHEIVHLTDSDWFSLYAEGPPDPRFDIAYLLAASNAVRVYVGDGKIRDRESAQYFVRWIDLLEKMSDRWLWWRTPEEKRTVFAEYDQARQIYLRLADEAR